MIGRLTNYMEFMLK